MSWFSPFVHPAGLLSAARLPLQVAVLTYVGAGGLAGAAVVGGVMLSPAREVVQEAVAPARHFVESVMPTLPSMFPTEPRQAVASQPIVDARPRVSVPAPISASAAPAVEDLAAEEVVAEATPTLEPRAVAPLPSGPLAQPTQLSPEPSVTGPPVAAIEPALLVMPGGPAAAIAIPSGSRPEVAQLPARATAVPASTRVAVGGAKNDDQRAAVAASPTWIAVHAQTSRTEPAATVPAVATAPPTSVPAAVPTLAPIEVPTQAPTAAPTRAPSQAPTRAPTTVPTQEPKKTGAPPKTAAARHPEPTKGAQGPAKATPEPAHAAPPAAHEKEDKSKSATPRKPTEPPGRPADAPPPSKHEGG